VRVQCIGQQFWGWGELGWENGLRLGNDLLSTVKMGWGWGFAKHGKERGFCKLRIAGPIFRQLHCGTNLFINPFAPELNPSPQRYLTRFCTGDFAFCFCISLICA
jgi:hypothetical protein